MSQNQITQPIQHNNNDLWLSASWTRDAALSQWWPSKSILWALLGLFRCVSNAPEPQVTNWQRLKGRTQRPEAAEQRPPQRLFVCAGKAVHSLKSGYNPLLDFKTIFLFLRKNILKVGIVLLRFFFQFAQHEKTAFYLHSQQTQSKQSSAH